MTTLSRRRRVKGSVQPGRPTGLQVEHLEDRTLLTAGALDPTFGTGGLVTTAIPGPTSSQSFAAAREPGGRFVLVGGAERQFAVARYDPTGTLDPTFGTGGQVLTALRPGPSASAEARAVAIQPDGRIVVAGLSTEANQKAMAVVRYLVDGRLDATFGTEGKVLTDFGTTGVVTWVGGVVIQTDGRIVVAGTIAPSEQSAAFALVRLNPDGSLDTAFGSEGKVVNAIGVLNGVALQADGKIVATGSANRAFLTARYLTNGSLDSTFGAAGMVSTSFDASGSAAARSVVIQADGKILVGGGTFINAPRFPFGSFALARYNPDGTLDNSFGRVMTSFTPPGLLPIPAASFRLTLQPDGKVLAVGSVGQGLGISSRVVLARYTATGTLDSSFGSEGKLAHEALSIGTDVLLSDGGIVVTGTFYGANLPTAFGAARFTGTGTFDTTFGTGGRVLSYFTGAVNLEDPSLLLQLDGKVIVIGVAYLLLSPHLALVRHNADGSLDNSFGAGGRVLMEGPPDLPIGFLAALSVGGKIIVAGSNALLRFNPDGSLDNTFGTGGIARIRFGPDGAAAGVSHVVLQPDDKILVAGIYTRAGGPQRFFALARFNAGGSPDASFAARFPELGPRIGPTNLAAVVQGITLQPDGKVLVSVYDPDFASKHALLRFNPDGSLDATLGTNGIAVTVFSGLLALAPDRRIVLVGQSTPETFNDKTRVARYLATGVLDPTFGSGGLTAVVFGAFPSSSSLTDVAMQPDGKIVLAGTMIRPHPEMGGRPTLARLDVNGSLDPTFGNAGQATVDLDTASGIPVQLARLADGRLVIGASVSVNRVGHFGLARLLADDVVANPNQRYVTQLYADLLGRNTDPVGLASWTAFLDRGGSRPDLVTHVTASLEYRTVVVRGLYRRVLGRDGEPTGLVTWVGFLNHGGTAEQLEAIFLGSDEYFRRAGGTANGFLTALYRDALGRAPDPVGIREFSPMVTARIPLTMPVAAAVLRSAESDRREVQALYRRYLRRDPDPVGHDALTGLLQRGLSNELILALVVGSEEYFSRV